MELVLALLNVVAGVFAVIRFRRERQERGDDKPVTLDLRS